MVIIISILFRRPQNLSLSVPSQNLINISKRFHSFLNFFIFGTISLDGTIESFKHQMFEFFKAFNFSFFNIDSFNLTENLEAALSGQFFLVFSLNKGFQIYYHLLTLIVYWLFHTLFRQIEFSLLLIPLVFNCLIFVNPGLHHLINWWLFVSVNWICYFSTMLDFLEPYFFLILEIDYPVVWLSAVMKCGSLLFIILLIIRWIFYIWYTTTIICLVFGCSLKYIISDAHTCRRF